ncbi:glycosyltransferase family 4 protein [Bacillus carboniphilus]|uniref:Glycosyltransferase family 4 protein n=1 Tax=Bacillus carboniphilus TaxID=86663 RepID=A0ABY9K0H0_9BACI|nr:glycosyltransferase family 4 protein [Bacillus carboniphilus]WLR44218.1 glycosyltransferase family 4 protein [Bacillus carboniphilus]
MLTKKILLCATVDYHFKAFHIPLIEWLKKNGWEIHVAANGEIRLPYVDYRYSLPFVRNPIHLSNARVYRRLKEIIDKNEYNIIHCHTPVGGLLARLAARKSRLQKTRVLYTAHGFHFCKGAPLKNWFLYYPIEKILSTWTDGLITINNEDYQFAKSHRFPANKIFHVHGVGIDLNKFSPISIDQKKEYRKAYGYSLNDFLIFYGAEFNKNKNQQLIIRALNEIKEIVPNVKLLLAGEGKLQNECKELSKKLKVAHLVDFLGFRKDINKLLQISDCTVASSNREGLPVNVMEGMATGLPVIAKANRGHNELVINDQNGWVINNKEELANKLITLIQDEQLAKLLGNKSRERIEQLYSIEHVLKEQQQIYHIFQTGLEEQVWSVQ